MPAPVICCVGLLGTKGHLTGYRNGTGSVFPDIGMAPGHIDGSMSPASSDANRNNSGIYFRAFGFLFFRKWPRCSDCVLCIEGRQAIFNFIAIKSVVFLRRSLQMFELFEVWQHRVGLLAQLRLRSTCQNIASCTARIV